MKKLKCLVDLKLKDNASVIVFSERGVYESRETYTDAGEQCEVLTNDQGECHTVTDRENGGWLQYFEEV